MRVLLIEDDRMIGAEMLRALQKDSYAVDWVRDGQAALDSVSTQHYGLILLDLGLPKRDGMAVLTQLRAVCSPIPVIIVTARDGVEERVAGLDTGADDYVLKPFVMSELLARIRAVVRRKSGHVQAVLSNGTLVLNPVNHTAICGNTTEVLSAKEYSLLHALLLQPGTILSRSELEDRLYGWNDEVESNAIEFLIHSVRKKLGKDSIINIRGVGWMVSKES